jgi:hypothetical protein
MTSPIVEIVPNNSWARTLNTLYALGKSMPDDEKFDAFINGRIAALIQELFSASDTRVRTRRSRLRRRQSVMARAQKLRIELLYASARGDGRPWGASLFGAATRP